MDDDLDSNGTYHKGRNSLSYVVFQARGADLLSELSYKHLATDLFVSLYTVALSPQYDYQAAVNNLLFNSVLCFSGPLHFNNNIYLLTYYILVFVGV